MFAKIVKKWNVFKADYKEYKELERECVRLQKAQDAAYNNIYTFSARYDLQPGDLKCLGAVKNPETDVYEDKICAHYWNEGDACTNTKCKHHSALQEYVRAKAEYADAVSRRREFWKNAKSRKK